MLKIKCIEKINLKQRPQNTSLRGPDWLAMFFSNSSIHPIIFF